MYLVCWLGLPLVAQCALAWTQYAEQLWHYFLKWHYTEHVKQNLNFACESLY